MKNYYALCTGILLASIATVNASEHDKDTTTSKEGLIVRAKRTLPPLHTAAPKFTQSPLPKKAKLDRKDKKSAPRSEIVRTLAKLNAQKTTSYGQYWEQQKAIRAAVLVQLKEDYKKTKNPDLLGLIKKNENPCSCIYLTGIVCASCENTRPIKPVINILEIEKN